MRVGLIHILLVSSIFFSIENKALAQNVPKVQWSKCIGGSATDGVWGGTKIIKTLRNTYIVISSAYSSDNDFQELHYGTNQSTDVVIVEIDSTGKILRKKNFGGSSYDFAQDVFQLSNGNVVLLFSSESGDFDLTGVNGSGYNRTILFVLDSSWNILLRKNFRDLKISRIKENPLGGYLCAVNDDLGIPYFGKLDSLGEVTQLNRWSGSSIDGYAYITDFIILPGGGYKLGISSTKSMSELSPCSNSADDIILTLNDNLDLINKVCYPSDLLDDNLKDFKLFNDGSLLKETNVQKFGPGSSYYISNKFMRVDSLGGIINEKDFYSTNSYSNQKLFNNTIIANDQHIISGGFSVDSFYTYPDMKFYDALVSKFDTSLKKEWEITFGGSREDNIHSVVEAGQDEYILAGFTISKDRDVVGNHGEGDIWLVKLGKDKPCDNYNPFPDTLKVCEDSLLLDAGKGYRSYFWDSGDTSQTFMVREKGDYRVTVTDSSGCMVSDRFYVSLFKTRIVQNDTTVCPGAPLTLSLDSSFTGIKTSYQIGDVGPAKGIIFYDKGYYSDGWRYMEGTTSPINTDQYGYYPSYPWMLDPMELLNTNDVFGEYNTKLISSFRPFENNAANACLKYRGSGFPNWFLPSSGELTSLFSLFRLKGMNSWRSAWSSSESAKSFACRIYNEPGSSLGLSCSVAKVYLYPVFATRYVTSYDPRYKVKWTTGDTSYSIQVNPKVTTTYYVTMTDGVSICTDSMTVTIGFPDTSIAALDPLQVCKEAGKVRLHAGLSDVGNVINNSYQWLKDLQIIEGATSAQYDASEIGAYSAIVTSSYGCMDTTRELSVILNPAPDSPVGTDGIRCGSGTVTLSASVPSGQTVSWYSSATGGTLLATGSNYTTPSISTTTVYYAEAVITATGCVSSTRTPVTASVVTTLNIPTVTNNARCGTGTVLLTATSSTGTTVAWFSSSTSTTLLSTASSYTTPSIKSTTTYYVESRLGTCRSARAPITASVFSVPAAPIAISGSRCGPGVVTIGATSPSGATVDWWSASTGGSLLLQGNPSYNTTSINTTTSYYAASRLGDYAGCVSTNRTAVTATINPIPTAPTANGVSRYCGAGTVNLTATVPIGQTIAWYSVTSGGTALSTSSPYTTASLSADTAFYVEARTTTCTSSTRTRVPVTVSAATPPAPSVTNGSRCGTGTVPLLATPPANATVAWFSTATSTTVLATTNNYTTPSISGTTSYWVESRFGTTCVSSPRTEVKAIVNSLPTAPTAGTIASRCGAGSITVSAIPPDANSTIDWYAASTGGTALASSTSTYTANITATTTFYAASRNTLTGCVSSARTGITATVNALPSAPTSISGTLSACPANSTTYYNYTAKSVSGSAGYVWSIPVCASTFNPPSTTNSISITLTGAGTKDSIYVQTRSSAGCLSTRKGVNITTATNCTACVAQVVTTSKFYTSIESLRGEEDNLILTAHPNPSRGVFRIQLMSGDHSTPVRLRVLDLMGRVVEDFGRVNAGIIKELGTNYHSGIYIIEAIHGEERRQLKLVKVE